MKRSEMIEKIWDVLSYKNNKLRDIGEDATAEEVLEIIEKDMYPPISKVTEFEPGGYVRVWTLKWEKEDD